MHDTVAGMPEAIRDTVSSAATPLAWSNPHCWLTLFAQPRPAPPTLPHGHGVVTSGSRPSPAQNGSPAVAAEQSARRRKFPRRLSESRPVLSHGVGGTVFAVS